MAKINLLDDVKINVINAFCEGDKIALLDSTTLGCPTIVTYVDGEKKYANGLCSVVYSEGTLRPFVLSLSALTAQSATPIEVGEISTTRPQLSSTISRDIARTGSVAVQRLQKQKTVVEVAHVFPMVCHRKDSTLYNWSTVGLEPTNDVYTVKDKNIVLNNAKISIEECKTFFDTYVEEQTKRLQK